MRFKAMAAATHLIIAKVLILAQTALYAKVALKIT